MPGYNVNIGIERACPGLTQNVSVGSAGDFPQPAQRLLLPAGSPVMQMLNKVFVLVSLTFVFFVALSYLYVTDRLNWNAVEGLYVVVASKLLSLFS
jgi:hypothetical protein